MSVTQELHEQLSQVFNDLATGGDAGDLPRRTLFEAASQLHGQLALVVSAENAQTTITRFDQLDDVAILEPFEGQFARYIDGRWRNSDVDLDAYALVGHDHDTRYYTKGQVNNLLLGKSDTGHNHDDRYYTETEIEGKLLGFSRIGHNHYYGSLMGLPDFQTILAPYSRIGHVHDYNSLMNLPPVVVGVDETYLRSALAPYSRIGHVHDYYSLMNLPVAAPVVGVDTDALRAALAPYARLGHNHRVEVEAVAHEFILAGQIFGG